jgi:hypothetical protein
MSVSALDDAFSVQNNPLAFLNMEFLLKIKTGTLIALVVW